MMISARIVHRVNYLCEQLARIIRVSVKRRSQLHTECVAIRGGSRRCGYGANGGATDAEVER